MDNNIRNQQGQIVWQPNKGWQELALAIPSCTEILAYGPRGSGKSDWLIADFLRYVGVPGYGPDYKGMIYRENYANLHDIMGKAEKMIKSSFPDARFTGHPAPVWTFKTGEQLLFRYFEVPADYWRVHGFSLSYLAVDELCQYPDLILYNDLKGLLRTTNPRIIPRVRAATNTYGPGNQPVRNYFRPDIPHIQKVTQILKRYKNGRVKKKTDWYRFSIFAPTEENKPLMEADPGYLANLTMNLKETDPDKYKSYVLGMWDCAPGGTFFEKVYDERIHVIDPFVVPSNWKIDRCLDFGTVKPAFCGFIAESSGDGNIYDLYGNEIHHIKGDLFLIDEIYTLRNEDVPNVGTGETAREFATRVKNKERYVRSIHGKNRRIYPGPADTGIWQQSGTVTIAQEMAMMGVNWIKAQKGRDTRIAGWEKMKSMLLNSKNPNRESPGFFIFNNCRNSIRTIPILRRDEKKPEDVNSLDEDHPADAIRYRMTMGGRVKSGRVKGLA